MELKTGRSAISEMLADVRPFGHKFSLTYIKPGSPIMKYATIISGSTTDVQLGQHVHMHSVTSAQACGNLAKEVKK
jgi:hypothetical protein